MSEAQNDKKSRKKIEKLFFDSELSEANNEPTFRIHQNQKNYKKSRKKNRKIIFDKISRKIIFGSELSEANNEPTLR